MSTTNGQQSDTITRHGRCIVSCGWLDCDGEHGHYCERTVGSNANAVTEPGWQKVQFWCSVIHPHIRGTVTRTHAADCDQYRDGVQLLADKRNEDGEWAELRFNLRG